MFRILLQFGGFILRNNEPTNQKLTAQYQHPSIRSPIPVHGTPCTYNGDCGYVNGSSVLAEGLEVVVLTTLL
jgi:hypothetical protein